jgi:hypothetical protein
VIVSALQWRKPWNRKLVLGTADLPDQLTLAVETQKNGPSRNMDDLLERLTPTAPV